MSGEKGESRGNTRTMACMNGVKNNNAVRGCRPGRLFSCHRTKGWQECTEGCRAGSFSQRGQSGSRGRAGRPDFGRMWGRRGRQRAVTYWSNLEGSGPQAYFKKNIEKPFEK